MEQNPPPADCPIIKDLEGIMDYVSKNDVALMFPPAKKEDAQQKNSPV